MVSEIIPVPQPNFLDYVWQTIGQLKEIFQLIKIAVVGGLNIHSK